jgi:hypothetical protein
MIVDWLYNHPVWIVGVVIVGGTILLSCLGLLVFHRLVDHAVRREHNDIVSATLTVVGTVAALLLAFIGVETWQTFSDAQGVAEAEAGAAGNLYFDSSGLPADGIRDALRSHIKNYLHIVIDQEWPMQQRGKLDGQAAVVGQNELLRINQELAAFNPQTAGQTNIHAEMFRTLNELFRARRNRIQAARGHVPLVVWAIILLGTAGTIGYTYFFGPPSLTMHLAITGSVAASLALAILLIVIMDYPFRGEVSVNTESYQTIRDAINTSVMVK